MSSKNDAEALVCLVQAAKEDPDLRRKLINLLGLDSFNRSSVLNTFLQEIQLQGAPPELIEAIAYLRNEEIATQAKSLLENSENSHQPINKKYSVIIGSVLILVLVLFTFWLFNRENESQPNMNLHKAPSLLKKAIGLDKPDAQ